MRAGERRLQFAADVDRAVPPRAAEPGTLDEFLIERYTAFTLRRRSLYRFRIEHAPWKIVPATVEINDAQLLGSAGALLSGLPTAHRSDGVLDVQISAPQRAV